MGCDTIRHDILFRVEVEEDPMRRLRTAARTGGIGFVVGFVLVGLLRGLRGGIGGGVVLGTLGVALGWVVSGALEEIDDLEELDATERRKVDVSPPADPDKAESDTDEGTTPSEGAAGEDTDSDADVEPSGTAVQADDD